MFPQFLREEKDIIGRWCRQMGLLVNIILSFVFCFVFCANCFADICVNTSINPEFNIDVSSRGSELAFQDDHFSNYRLFSADSNAEFFTQIKEMARGSSCSVILGLVTSRACLIAGPILRKYKTISISPICGHDSVGNFYPYLYTATFPISKEAEVIIDYLNKRKKPGKIFAIYQATDIYSMAEFSQFKKRCSKIITEIPLSSDGQFDVSKFQPIKGEENTLIFFTSPLPSVKALVVLSDHQLITKDLKIIGSSSWNDQVSLLKHVKPILRRAKLVIAVDVLNWDKVRNSSFTKTFIKKFNREPLNVEVINYDVTRLTIKCYRQSLVNEKYNVDKFQYCLAHTVYHGASGIFSFTNHSSFADRPAYMTNILERM